MGRSVRLANEDLHVDVLPENGGRIASIRCRRTKTEFLVSGSSYETTAAFPDDAPFEVSDCAGWDECLPTVSLSTSDGGECDAPDHGDLWRHPWAIHEQSSDHIVLSTECFSRPLNFGRSLRLDKNRIRLDYSISNRGKKTEAFIYACHPLFAVDPGDRVLLPSEVSTVRLHSSRLDRIGNPGDQIHWPFTVPDFEATAIDCVGDISDGTAEMFYVESLKRSACALYRLQRQQALVMRFTPEPLPVLGLWICSGGWPEQPNVRKQHAVALEPTVAPFGSLAKAVRANSAPTLNPGTEFKFSIEIEIVGCNRPYSCAEISDLLEKAPL